jgi:hypothetical protein
MEPPDKRLFDADLAAADFRNGVVNGWWDLAEAEVLPPGLTWPRAILWIAPAPRSDAPSRFYVSLDVAGYRAVPPTGAFWDLAANGPLDAARRPKGRDGSRVAKVFRTAGRAVAPSTIPMTGSPHRGTRRGRPNSRIFFGHLITPLSITCWSFMGC